jgi:DNA-binding IclR family transcriptional regulator
MGPQEVSAMLDAVGEVRLATGRVLTRVEFLESLRQISEWGYAFGSSQRATGAASISVPVMNRGDVVIAAIQIAGLEEDFDPGRRDWYVGELNRASAAITRRNP